MGKESAIIGFRNFGLIQDATIELSKLDIFVGKNVTGKSYAAMLIYAILNVFGSGRPVIYRGLPFRVSGRSQSIVSEEVRKEFAELVKTLLDNYTKGDSRLVTNNDLLEIPFSLLTSKEMDIVENMVKGIIVAKGNMLSPEVSRCFGAEMPTLVRAGCDPNELSISLRQDSPSLDILFTFDGTTFQTDIKSIDIRALKIEIPRIPYSRPGRPNLKEKSAVVRFATDMALDVLAPKVFKFAHRGVVYLPAARSGIIQAQRAIASTMVEMAPLAGLREVEIPALAGTISDFLSGLFLMRDFPVKKSKFSASLILEEEILGGHVSLQTRGERIPNIAFESTGQSYPIYLASSMVSELAPLVLFLRNQVHSGDIVIIEEPEAHLHPGAQVALAKVIARMIRENLNLVITTHSEFLITELNNYIRRGAMEPDQRKLAGYFEHDFIEPDEVRGYLFDTIELGKKVNVKRLQVTPEEGIPADEIDRVSLALHEDFTKTYNLLLERDGRV